MTTITLSSNTAISAWQTSTSNADRVVSGITLTGVTAAAYHFGEALRTVKFQGLLDGVQLTDGRFEFPPASGQWVSLSEVADALHYKYGVDPLIEFAPGLGLRGYSVADINTVLERLNQEFKGQFTLSLIDSAAVKSTTQSTFNTEKVAANSAATYNATAVASLLDAASTSIFSPATEAELRQRLTEGGDLYVDRRGAFFINGVPTTAKDVAVVSRLLAQDNIAAEYKVLMDDYTERNNLIASARTVIDGGFGSLLRSTYSLSQQYGMADVLSELTSGQYSDTQITPQVKTTNINNDSVSFYHDPGWLSGTKVEIATAGGGLSATNSTNPALYYYVRNLGQGNYSFYTYPPDATSNPPGSTLVNLTSAVASEVWPSAGQSQSISQLGTNTMSAKFPPSTSSGSIFYTNTNTGWVTGTVVTFPTGTSGGLVAGREYFIRNEGKDTSGTEWYGVFDTYAHAIGSGETGRLSSYNNAGSVKIFEPNILRFPSDPLWIDGTRVRVEQTESGLTAGVDYYARSLGSGRYSFFTSAASAKLTGSPRPTVDRVSITGEISSTNRVQPVTIDSASFDSITALLNTLISNKVRDGDLDQAKLQTLTAQLQNNTEAMTALIKVFSDLNATLVQALR